MWSVDYSLELPNYFTKILEDDLKAVIKPQYVDQKDELKRQNEVCKVLDLLKVKDRDVKDLLGGELQRIACAMVCIQAAHIFMFDEPVRSPAGPTSS